MNYPLISEYVEAIKMAEDNFEELSYLRPVLDDTGQPVMSSGNFAVVFKMKDERDGKLYAVRCFHRAQEGREESYRLIEEELKDVESPYLLSFRYIDKELFVDSSQTDETEFPVLLMDWVEGITLDKYLHENLDDQYALEMLAYRFSQLAQWLIPQPFAHGDLKPDNILVREDGTLALVDYDGMYVPAMKGQKARELGSPDFRHPLRTENDFDEHIDDFPFITILLSLKCFSFNPKIHEELEIEDDFLFHESDYRDVAHSVVCQFIVGLTNNPEIVRLYAVFMIVLAERKIDTISLMLLFHDNDFRKVYKNSKAKAQWDNDSKYCLSCCLLHGIGVEKDIKRGVALRLQLAKQGDSRSQNSIGWAYNKGRGVPVDYEKAFEWWKKAAEQGNISAHFNIALCYEKGLGVVRNQEKAVECYTIAAEQGLASAQYKLGTCYMDGIGVVQDNDKAMEWWRKAAEQEHQDAIYALARSFCGEDKNKDELDRDKAFALFEKAANLGNAEAQCCVGCCYKNGYGTPVDYSKAGKWYNKSAKKGCTRALRHIAMCYEDGLGVEKNMEKAIKWYKEAIHQGDKTSMVIMGKIYYYGRGGVNINFNKAIEYYLMAANNEESEGMWRVGVCYQLGHGIAVDENEAVEWYRKSARKDNPTGQWRLGECYYKGCGIEIDYTKAVEWYTKAAGHGNATGQGLLGFCYYNGCGIEKDYTKAVEWFTKAAEQGHSEGQWRLGNCYYGGHGIEKDYVKAVEWYTKAAEQGHSAGQWSLGNCYYNGHGIEKNYIKAIEWFKKASEQGFSWAFYQLAVCYKNGHGVPVDYVTALEYVNKAENMGGEKMKEKVTNLRTSILAQMADE